MKYLKLKLTALATSLFCLLTLIAPLAQSQGLIAEHVNNLNTLALSFVDLSQPMYAIKLQIMNEFLSQSADPKLILLVTDDRDIKNLNSLIKSQNAKFDLNKIKFVKGESTFLSSPWMRDLSPMMILKKDGSQKLVTFKHIDASEMDYAVDQKSLAVALAVTNEKINLALPGGNIFSDELGRIYLSTAVIENNAGPGADGAKLTATKNQIENLLMAKMLAKEIVWIPRLNREFETTGHVDMYIRLLKNKQAIVAKSNEPQISKALDVIAKIIESKGFTVTRLQANSMMENKYRKQRIFPSYTNSILVGNSIFIPKFGVAEDKVAVGTYQKLGYKVIQIDGESIHFGGSVHCLTYLYP